MDKVPTWQEYFIDIAKAVSRRSKDPSRKVGSIITTKENIIIGTGYNGFKSGDVESPELWERPIKYTKVVHAEINAINFTININNYNELNIYCTTYPCINCMKEIIKTPIKTIYYKEEYTDFKDSNELANINSIVSVKV